MKLFQQNEDCSMYSSIEILVVWLFFQLIRPLNLYFESIDMSQELFQIRTTFKNIFQFHPSSLRHPGTGSRYIQILSQIMLSSSTILASDNLPYQSQFLPKSISNPSNTLPIHSQIL